MEEERETTCFEDIGAHFLRTPADSPRYNLRDLFAYSDAKGMDPADLTDEERDQFRTN